MLTIDTIKWLSEKQKTLDSYIIEKKQLVINQEMLDKKIVAFLVELGEYANEERVFKYWSNKKEAELNIQLDEYIDCIHFLISIGNQIGFDFSKFESKQLNFENNIKAYFDIIDKLNNFTKTKNSQNYNELLNSFLNISDVKKYSEQQIIDAYKIKNQINFDRQNNNY